MGYRKDFFPDADIEIFHFSRNFAQKISADPPMYGLDEARAAEYVVLQQRFTEAYLAARTPGTRTSVGVMATRSARKELERMSRYLAKVIRAQPSVSDEQKISLGLKLSPGRKSRVAAPSEAPSLSVESVQGSTITLRLRDASNFKRRGRPRDAWCAAIFATVGAQPVNIGHYPAGLTGKVRCRVTMPPSVPEGAKVWVSARWVNQRGEAGPMAAAVHAYTQLAGLPTEFRSRNGNCDFQLATCD